jgi:hypothetical protein
LGKANLDQQDVEQVIIPTCPLHNYTGPDSLSPAVTGCKSCCEVSVIHVLKTTDKEKGYVKPRLLEALIHHWVEMIKRGDVKTADDLVSRFEVLKNGEKMIQ